MSDNTNGDSGGDLRARREAAGLSQLDVAVRAPCSPAMVGLLERGYQPQRSAVLDRVIAVLNDETQPGQAASRATSAVVGDGLAPA